MVIKNGSYFSSSNNLKSYKKFICIDANGKSLGRVASVVAQKLLGKNDHLFKTSSSTSVYITILNANSIILTGRKEEKMIYRRHSGRPGGLKLLSYKQVKERNPKLIFERAVKGMLPKNRYGRKLFKSLEISFK